MRSGTTARLTGERFNEAHHAVAESVDGYLRTIAHRSDDLVRQMTAEDHFPDEIMDAMANLGLYGALIPEEYGGSGLGLLAMVIGMERFAAFGLSNTLALLTTMDTMAILSGGTEPQKKEWLPRIAEGSVKMAFAITEPDAGTNSFKMKLHARPQGDGSVRITGEKAWITGVDRATHILVVARTSTYNEVVAASLPRSWGLSLFILPSDAEGLTRTRMNTMGIEGFHQFQLHFDDVHVDADHTIGEIDQGARVLFDALNPERISSAAFAVGSVDYFLNKAVNYANQRVVFGDAPIGSYQAVQHPLARIRAQQEAVRLLTYEAAAAFDNGAPGTVVGTYTNMAKLLSSEVAYEAVDRAIQTHGGNGFVLDYGLIQMLATTRLNKTAPINNEMILNFISEHELGLPKSY